MNIKMILKNIVPTVCLQSGKKAVLKQYDETENAVFFKNDREDITLCLRTEKDGDVYGIFADCTVKEAEFTFDNIDYLNSECALELFVPQGGANVEYSAVYLHSEFWCEPSFGTDFKDIPGDTQALTVKNGDMFTYILPVCSEQYKCTMKGDTGGFKFQMYSWCVGLNRCNGLAFVIGEGENPYEISKACTKTALDLLGTGGDIRENKRYPEVFEYLGWCSWDAMHISVNKDGLCEKFDEFKEKSIPVKWGIIDCIWEHIDGLNAKKCSTFKEIESTMQVTKLYDFEADYERFPGGLKNTIDLLHEKYGIKVGMWHPTTGSWKGIDPCGVVAKEFSQYLTKTGDGRIVHSFELEKAFGFYNAYHSFLKHSGADFVKIDNQSFIRGYFKGRAPVGEIAKNIQTALEASAGAYFDNKTINCMGMAQENMFNRRSSNISRASDDFQPENREWFIHHIMQCSYNSFMQGNFLWCDWDMWWTGDTQALKNSVLRAISGGPIYISDPIGKSRKDIIEPLVFSDGRILRCDSPAVPTSDCLTVNPKTSGNAFKLWSKCGDGMMLAAFNLSEDEKSAVTGSISFDNFYETDADKVLVYEYFSKEAKIISKNEKIDFSLENRDDIRLFAVVPVKNGFAYLGNKGKYSMMKSIIHRTENSLTLYEGGEFMFYCENPVDYVLVNGHREKTVQDGFLTVVDCNDKSGRINVCISADIK